MKRKADQIIQMSAVIRVPLTIKRRSGRKTVILANAPEVSSSKNVDGSFVRALAKAYRWRRQIEDGEFASITELAKAKGINQSYACRVLRLSLLSPRIVDQAVAKENLTMINARKAWSKFADCWSEQTRSQSCGD